MSVRVRAPAKINLTLKVGPPRADGMHPLESIIAFAEVCDFVKAEAGQGLSLAIDGPFAAGLSAGDDNLVFRAARALAEASDRPADARLSLEKNLPIASGIGGGSADAAATLRALNDLWGLNWTNEQLGELGGRLGADVPVFFTSGAGAFMTGVGEICAPVHIWALPAVLINPLKPLPTPDVYRAFDQMMLGSELQDAPPPDWADAEEAIADMRRLGNDLEPAARALMPDIGDIVTELAASPYVRHAALSGSGATVFAITHDWDGAEALASELREHHPLWWVAETTLGA